MKKNGIPKVIMAASVAAMGMGLFSTLDNEARATGTCIRCGNSDETECQRVIIDDTVHYFAGPRSECD